MTMHESGREHIELVTFDASHCAAARALWQRTPGVGLSAADEVDALQRFLARNQNMSLVAHDEAMIVGTILVGHDGRRGLIHHLAVDVRARRRGIGRRLVDEGLARLAAAGIDKCHLLVFSSNAEGRAFWSAIGAEHRDGISLYSLVTATQAGRT